MLTQFILEGDRDTIEDQIHGNTLLTPSFSASDKRLKYSDTDACFYWEEVGRQNEPPAVLKGLRILRVVIRHNVQIPSSAFYTPGKYHILGAHAYVEHTGDRGGTIQYTTVWANSLELANGLMDMIQVKTVKPITVEPPATGWGNVKRSWRKVLRVLREHASYFDLRRKPSQS